MKDKVDPPSWGTVCLLWVCVLILGGVLWRIFSYNASERGRQHDAARQAQQAEIELRRKNDPAYDVELNAFELGYQIGAAAKATGGANLDDSALARIAGEAADDRGLTGAIRERFIAKFIRGFRWGW